MRIVYFICLLVNISPLLAQNVDTKTPINLCQMNIELHQDSIQTLAYGYSSFINYQGELTEGVGNIFGYPVTRIKTNKNSPKKYIKYNVNRNFKIDELIGIVINTLEKEFEFTTHEIYDTCDVWRIFVSDSSKLVTWGFGFLPEEGTNNYIYRDFFGATFTTLAKYLEEDSRKYIFVTDSNDTMDEPKRFKFIIPMSFIKNIDLLKAFMFEKYGIELLKEKKVIKKLYLKFTE